MPQPLIHASLLLLGIFSLQATAATSQEIQELTLALKQLRNVNTILERAESQAKQSSTTSEARFSFDYDRLHADLQRVASGIQQYLTPSRAQPRDADLLDGNYSHERDRP